MNICLILSGSIAAYKACELASLLVKAGHTVQTVATEAALRFVGEASLEGLTDRAVYTDLWARRESKTHISLRKWLDLFVFYPATANRINELATGLAPDLIGATFLANNFEKPFWIAPAMNTNMLRHPATQAALARLEAWGCRIIPGDDGRLACGDVGEGRLAEARTVFGLIQNFAREVLGMPSSGQAGELVRSPGPRLLLSGGAMTEKIDGVRAITNTSSGRTAAGIARTFLERGWMVDFLHHGSADLEQCQEWLLSTRLNLIEYGSFTEFEDRLNACLRSGPYTAVIHAAAISDYRVGRVAALAGPDLGQNPAKLESGQPLQVELLPNPKLLLRLRPESQGKPVIVAFKLTVGGNENEGQAKAQAFIDHNQADLVVWNDMGLLSGRHGTAVNHPFVVFGRAGFRRRGSNNQELALALFEAVSEKMQGKAEHE